MKTLILFSLFLSLSASAEVAFQDCLDDAKLNGNHKTPVKPLPECVSILKAKTEAISVTSSDMKWKAFGADHMIYVEQLNDTGVLLDRVLLSGEETELVSVQKIFIDAVEKRLLVIQVKNEKSELLIFDLEFLGNVTPMKVMRNNIFNGVTSVSFSGENDILVVNALGSYIVKADGESRTELSTKKALQITPQ